VIRVYTLGRSAEQSIDVGPDFKRVSRRHAEIAVLGPNAYRITDLGSANGTEVFDGHRWISVSQATISRDQRFRLGGEFEATVEELIREGRITESQAGEPEQNPEAGSIFRNIELRHVVGLALVAALAAVVIAVFIQSPSKLNEADGGDAGERETQVRRCGRDVTVYFKEGCKYCEATEHFLDDNNIQYTGIDITDPEVLRALVQKYGRVEGVPFVVIDDEDPIVGHNEARLRRSLCLN
jgi:glutaredoxin